MKLIIYSSDDLAGANIAETMISTYGFEESEEGIYSKDDILLFQVEGSVKDLTTLPYSPEYCVVASRHKAESGNKTLTVHPTGNFGKAQMGGSDSRLQMTDSHVMRQAHMLLHEKREKYALEYNVTREVTHHGPTDLQFPLLYVEVGSTEAEWKDMKACTAVAETIYELVSNEICAKPSLIGFGGPHYAPNFNPLATDYAVGHIMPKYSESYMSKEIVLELIGKTSPKPDYAAIDWKGLSGQAKKNLTSILDEVGLRWEKTTNLK
ncbi:MAG: hypothetical protein KKD39_03375 [Candidatus Altiarchaeota archaeon]|nr:hypothetical protein [Candidatus Altiarchaeota archaeon]